MRTPAQSRWYEASEKIREKLRGRKGADELVRLLDRIERACIDYGREVEQEVRHLKPSRSKPH